MGRSRISWHHLVILLAVLALFASVSTRTFHGNYVLRPSVQADSPHVTHQHFDADAFQLIQPAYQFSIMLLPVAAPQAPPEEPQVRTIEFTKSLSNRAPPSSSLL